MHEPQFIVNSTDKPNSFEFGKAGQRHKIYYNSVNELLTHIEKLKNVGLYKDDDK